MRQEIKTLAERCWHKLSRRHSRSRNTKTEASPDARRAADVAVQRRKHGSPAHKEDPGPLPAVTNVPRDPRKTTSMVNLMERAKDPAENTERITAIREETPENVVRENAIREDAMQEDTTPEATPRENSNREDNRESVRQGIAVREDTREDTTGEELPREEIAREHSPREETPREETPREETPQEITTRQSDVDKDTTYAPAVTHETVHSQIREEIQERIYRDIHTYDVYHRVQPIHDVEILPARHFILDSNEQPVEVDEAALPECTGPNQRWRIETTEPPSAPLPPKDSDELRVVKKSEPIRSQTAEGFERVEETIIHPPTLDDSSLFGVPVMPIHFIHHEPGREGDRGSSKGVAKPARTPSSVSLVNSTPILADFAHLRDCV
ncbi:hypothetical protein F4778DRAFT_760383 [Xylariomycetidae sp. FL2044]|nr:hypothetical protein F4778DRAFT_760336 [Xylariomycetidae sp. FL2044]KAH9885742.1 hypothetical protein F4778DRAFT_760383 [Xylariomycetidae sp. FL2044]